MCRFLFYSSPQHVNDWSGKKRRTSLSRNEPPLLLSCTHQTKLSCISSAGLSTSRGGWRLLMLSESLIFLRPTSTGRESDFIAIGNNQLGARDDAWGDALMASKVRHMEPGMLYIHLAARRFMFQKQNPVYSCTAVTVKRCSQVPFTIQASVRDARLSRPWVLGRLSSLE